MKSAIDIEEEAEKMVDGLEVVFTLSRVMMPGMGFTPEEAEKVIRKAARKLFERYRE